MGAIAPTAPLLMSPCSTTCWLPPLALHYASWQGSTCFTVYIGNGQKLLLFPEKYNQGISFSSVQQRKCNSSFNGFFLFQILGKIASLSEKQWNMRFFCFQRSFLDLGHFWENYTRLNQLLTNSKHSRGL